MKARPGRTSPMPKESEKILNSISFFMFEVGTMFLKKKFNTHATYRKGLLKKMKNISMITLVEGVQQESITFNFFVWKFIDTKSFFMKNWVGHRLLPLSLTNIICMVGPWDHHYAQCTMYFLSWGC